MDDRVRDILQVVGETAEQIDLEPEDLAIYLGESMVLNCPEIYQAVQKYSIETGLLD